MSTIKKSNKTVLRYRKKMTKKTELKNNSPKPNVSTYESIQKIINELLSHSIIKAQTFLQTNGLEIIKLKDIIYVAETFNYTNEKYLFNVYKLINIILVLYINGGMSWLEYFILIPQGRDEFRKMMKSLPELAIFLSSFIFLPKQISTDWLFSAIIKHIGLMTDVNFHSKYINQDFAIAIIYSIQATLYRKGMSFALRKANLIKVYSSLEMIKKYKRIVLKAKLSREQKDELLSVIIKIMTKKQNNPQVEISSFEHYITAIKSNDSSSHKELAEMALKEGHKIIIYQRNTKMKHNGGYNKSKHTY